MDNIEIKNSNELEIIKEVRQSWSREQIELDIEILTQQCVDIQKEIEEKKLLLEQLNNYGQ